MQRLWKVPMVQRDMGLDPVPLERDAARRAAAKVEDGPPDLGVGLPDRAAPCRAQGEL